MSLFPIFKVNKLTNKNIVDTIYVFYGHSDIDEITKQFIKDPYGNQFATIFDKKELDVISKNKTKIIFVKQSIHIDDSIGVIKLKIAEAIGEGDNNSKGVSINEMYLFCLNRERLNPVTVYQKLTQNDSIPLTRVRFNQLLLNIYSEDDTKPLDFELEYKEKYTFDDVLKLDLQERDYNIAKAIGQKFVFTDEYPFISDPFYVTEYDSLLERSRNEMSSLNNNLLLETGKIVKNTIYLCLAEDVFKMNELSTELTPILTSYTSKIYYPFLYRDNIDSEEKLQMEKNRLVNETNKKLSENTIRGFENIDLFYNIFANKTKSKQFTNNLNSSGIKSIKITIHPPFKINIPIEVIFKLIHATHEFPLIKFNPATRQENIYRLFTDKLTSDGRKIPFLEKQIIFKLMKNIGKNKSVSVYVNGVFNNIPYYIICEFDESGRITVYPLSEFDTPISLQQDNEDIFVNINDIIKHAVNPLIEQIKPFFEQSGLEFKLFKSIQETNIEIRDLNYQIVYSINKPLDISSLRGCVTSAFIIESDNRFGIQMRYKRVSNFNKFDSQEAFVIERLKQEFTQTEIIDGLLNNYDDITEDQAVELLVRIASEMQVTRGSNRKRYIEIKVNPGFKTNMTIKTALNSTTSELIIVVDGINDINYLNTLPVYLDSIVRITQDINSTKVDSSVITKLCYGTEIEDVVFDDIVALSEEIFSVNEVPQLHGDDIIYPSTRDVGVADVGVADFEEGQNMNDLLDILGFDDYDSELEGEMEGEMEGGKKQSKTPLNTNNDEISINSLELDTIDNDELDRNFNDEINIKLDGDLDKENTKIQMSNNNNKINELYKKLETSREDTFELDEDKKDEDKDDELDEDEDEDEGKEDELDEDVQNKVRNITGLKLQYPNPFAERLKEKMPNLFVRAKNEKIDLYSRMCPSAERRQPVILTSSEKERILKNHKGDIDPEADFIEYGNDINDPTKKFFYMCPRYWCLLTDTMVTEKDILEGKCGAKVANVEDAIIPHKATVVPKGKYVYKFYDDDTKKYPGFHAKQTTSGMCIPCCYNFWSTKTMKDRRDICQGKKMDDKKGEKEEGEKEEGEKGEEEEEKKEEKEAEREIKRDMKDAETYIKGPEKYPLGEFRWGYLPVAVEKFLHEINADCYISKNNTNLKPFHTCILRQGVENSVTQSFISCIANVMFKSQRDENTKQLLIYKFIPNATNEVPTIEQMKDIIINAIDIDRFIKYQNGDLITSFANLTLDVDIEKYADSQLYKKMVTNENIENKQKEIEFITRVAQAFETFILFLKDKTIYIDYTYLWDIICEPNPKLFINGLNLIVLEIPEDDVTNNIELVCPTNHYSTNMYNSKKRSLIIVKRDVYFEPIYAYRNEEKRVIITKTFSEYDKNISNSLRSVFLKIIKPTLGEKCKALLSKPNEYRFKQPPLLDALIKTLISKDYIVTKQVLNFQGKVIGVFAKNKGGLEGFIPCYPSSLTNLTKENVEYPFVYMTDDVWKSYNETLEFLTKYYKYKSKNDKEKCFGNNSFCKVVDEEMIVGFLTNTNQFIQINNPTPISSINDDVATITNNDYLIADIETLTTNKVDSKRVDFIKRIQLETNYYNVFRNTIRILLNDYLNSDKRQRLQEECNKQYIIYTQQLENVINMLHELVTENVIFVSEDDGYNYKNVNENDMHNCITIGKDKCEISNSVCRITNDKCSLILPKENLVTKTDNEKYYYGRMADELIRYNRIKSFIFKPQSYLSFGSVKYNLRDNEIIVLQDLLNSDFFNNLIPVAINSYAKYNTFDTAQPIISQDYTNEVVLEDMINKPNHIRNCFPSKPDPIKSIQWKNCFPKDYKEIKYTGNNFCGIYLIIDLVKEFNNEILNMEQVKDNLIEEYNILTGNSTNKDRFDKIVAILKEEGQPDANFLKNKSLNIYEMIIQDSFYPVNFDLWLLLNRYKIPSIMISSKPISETRFNHTEFVCYKSVNANPIIKEQYAFIVAPALRIDVIPEYKLIFNNIDNKIELNELNNECLQTIEDAKSNYYSITNYIDAIFEKGIKTGYKPKKKGIRNVENIQFDIIESPKFQGESPKQKVFKKLDAKINLEDEDDIFETIKDTLIEHPLELKDKSFEIIPVKKTRKKRNPKIVVNPDEKKPKQPRKTRKNVNVVFDIVE